MNKYNLKVLMQVEVNNKSIIIYERNNDKGVPCGYSVYDSEDTEFNNLIYLNYGLAQEHFNKLIERR